MQALTDWCTLRGRGCRCYAEYAPSVLSEGGTHGARQGCHNGGMAARWRFNAGIPGWPQWWPGMQYAGTVGRSQVGPGSGSAVVCALAGCSVLWLAGWLLAAGSA